MQEPDLEAAYQGSYYTILGAGGDLAEWVGGYTRLLTEREIGKPTAWFKTTGAAVNAYMKPKHDADHFPNDLTILMFPFDGMDTGRLAIFRLMMRDQWFDDIVDNARGFAPGDEEDG